MRIAKCANIGIIVIHIVLTIKNVLRISPIRLKILTGEGERIMKRIVGHIVLFAFMFTFLVMAACNKPVQPTATSGLKSEISAEAKYYNAGGLALAQKGQYQQAIDAYKKAIIKDVGYTEAYINCSKAYYAIGNYDMARYYNMKGKEILDSKATVIRESEAEQDEQW
jgi:tetratricopeptide (TPR) repeat protein